MSERPKAVSVLFRKNGLVLAVSCKNDHSDLGLPGGSVEEGETYAEAAIRETLEEVGVKMGLYRFARAILKRAMIRPRG